MERPLKQRLIGATILVAIAVAVLPGLLSGRREVVTLEPTRDDSGMPLRAHEFSLGETLTAEEQAVAADELQPDPVPVEAVVAPEPLPLTPPPGVPATADASSRASSCSLSSALKSVVLSVCCSRLTMARGVPAGAMIACHDPLQRPGNDASMQVGISGNCGERSRPVLTMTFIRPARTCGASPAEVLMASCTRPANSSVNAWLMPLNGT